MFSKFFYFHLKMPSKISSYDAQYICQQLSSIYSAHGQNS